VDFATTLLRRFCYSSRPQWDKFGKLISDGRGQHQALLSLGDRFGPDIWDRLKGKRVLDYGCGYGSDVAECASRGIEAVGLEHRQFLVDGARQRAEEAGVNGRFYHTSERDQIAGAFDCILSVNAFEHYLDPAGVLLSMRQLLKPTGGDVLIYFNPPWLHPYGGHCREMTAFPWVHLLFPESAVMRLRSEYYSEKPTCYEEAADGLSRMTIAKFKRVVADSPFTFRDLDLIAIRKFNVVTKIPGVQELFTSAIRAELTPA
jgi:SAM-dependent methyltransferase